MKLNQRITATLALLAALSTLTPKPPRSRRKPTSGSVV
jgi:hypothetical protein